ncbi:MAG: GreA/GreB family elongation factor [Clostridia bacterium]|nr:GreA/GreB family elongation factor [Clostridia bacterium]
MKEIYYSAEGMLELDQSIEMLKNERSEVLKKLYEARRENDQETTCDLEIEEKELSFKITEAQILRDNAKEIQTGSMGIALKDKVRIKLDGIEEVVTPTGAYNVKVLNGEISCNNPLTQKLLGKNKGDSFEFTSSNKELHKVTIIEVVKPVAKTEKDLNI